LELLVALSVPLLAHLLEQWPVQLLAHLLEAQWAQLLDHWLGELLMSTFLITSSALAANTLSMRRK
jgi:hypothetical protein